MRAPNLRHVQCVLVSAHGELVTERYFRDRRASDLSNVHSVAKSFLSTLVGMAIDDESLALTTTLGDLLPERVPPDDARKAAITVQHLLTMTSGLAAHGPYDIDEIANAGDSWVEGPLRAPLQSEPGTAFVYNNGAAHVLGVMLATAVGIPLERFAEDRLFGPLGIETYRWPRDPEGNVLGWGQLEVRPRDLLRFGELYLRRGRTGGRQILNPAYIDAATSAATQGGPPEEARYGYLWWVGEQAGRRAYFAGGFGGQYVTVVPELELVVVTTGDVAVFIPSSADPLLLVEKVVIPALSA